MYAHVKKGKGWRINVDESFTKEIVFEGSHPITIEDHEYMDSALKREVEELKDMLGM